MIRPVAITLGASAVRGNAEWADVLLNNGAQSAMGALEHLCTWRTFLMPCNPRAVGAVYGAGRSLEERSGLANRRKMIREEVVVNSLLVAAALIALSGPVMAQDKEMQVTPDALTWKENPAFPKGVQIATVVGDPTKSEDMVVLRNQVPSPFSDAPTYSPVFRGRNPD